MAYDLGEGGVEDVILTPGDTLTVVKNGVVTLKITTRDPSLGGERLLGRKNVTYEPSQDYVEGCTCYECKEERKMMAQEEHFVLESPVGLTINPGQTLTLHGEDGKVVKFTLRDPNQAPKGPDPAVWGDDKDRPAPIQPTSAFAEGYDEDETCPCCDEPSDYCDEGPCAEECSTTSVPYSGVPPGMEPSLSYSGIPNPEPSPVPRAFDIPELNRSDFREMLDACRNGKEFYMELHRSKGDYGYAREELIIALTRNFNDLIKAIIQDNTREILAEGLGLSNWADITVYNLAPFELDQIQDWVPVLMGLYKEGLVE